MLKYCNFFWSSTYNCTHCLLNFLLLLLLLLLLFHLYSYYNIYNEKCAVCVYVDRYVWVRSIWHTALTTIFSLLLLYFFFKSFKLSRPIQICMVYKWILLEFCVFFCVICFAYITINLMFFFFWFCFARVWVSFWICLSMPRVFYFRVLRFVYSTHNEYIKTIVCSSKLETLVIKIKKYFFLWIYELIQLNLILLTGKNKLSIQF